MANYCIPASAAAPGSKCIQTAAHNTSIPVRIIRADMMLLVTAENLIICE